MEIAKRDPILDEIEGQLNWLCDNLIGNGRINSVVLKRSLSYILFISTCKYASHLSFEQYRLISAAIESYKKYHLSPMNLPMTSFLAFAETFCEEGKAQRVYEESNRSVPRETLNDVMDVPSEFSAEELKAADEIFEAEKDVYVLSKLLRERDAVLRLRHSRLRLLLQNKEGR